MERGFFESDWTMGLVIIGPSTLLAMWTSDGSLEPDDDPDDGERMPEGCAA